MPLHSLRAVFMRGGTSKGLMFHRQHLPAQQSDWAPIFLSAMGAPDPNGRQLDGMGGGTSSLSKVCIIGAPTHPEADVDYTFAQIGIDQATVDYGANCGNMSAAVGPFAVDEGLIQTVADGETTVRIHNTNTRKLILARFAVQAGRAVVAGPLAVDGVAGTGASIRLEFRDLAGARTGRLLPTGQPLQTLSLPGDRAVRASLVDAANPCVFVDAADLAMNANERPEEMEANKTLMSDLEALRRQACILMGLAPDLEAAAVSRSVPFIGLVARPRAWRTRSGIERSPNDADLAVRMLSNGNAHRAIPITSALCAAVACRTPGTLPALLCGAPAGPLRIGHPSGTMMVEAERDAIEGRVLHASVYRTARRLFQGEVMYSQRAGDLS
jgi:2-methylaconitate cis-trans-isomerase PrpF